MASDLVRRRGDKDYGVKRKKRQNNGYRSMSGRVVTNYFLPNK